MADSDKMQDILHLISEQERLQNSLNLLLKISLEHLMELIEAYKTLEAKVYQTRCELTKIWRKAVNLERVCKNLEGRIAENEVTISKLKKTLKDHENHKYSGNLFIEIPDYLQKKAAAMTGTPSFYSDDFYTEYYGYRMCACVYLNGDGTGKGSHLSVYLVLKKGDHDNILSWPFKRHVTFTLRNQDSKDHKSNTLIPDPLHPSFQKPVEHTNVASGFPMFVAHSVIENPEEGFLRNDTIAIEVVVDQHDHS